MADEFVTTRWSMVLAAAQGEGSKASAAMEQLCRISWRPLYAFARRRGLSPTDAEDVVQGFFASLLEGNSLASLQRDRGRFRSFMLGGLKHHLTDETRKAQAAKRGGQAHLISLDLEDAEEQFSQQDLVGETPEHDFDRAWSLDLLSRARLRLADECAASGKREVFEALFAEGSEQGEESYAELGERLGIKEATLRSVAMRLRKRWGELIRAEVAETVNSREAFEEELACLKASLV